MKFKGKKVLISQHTLININGALTVPLELANFLKEEGAEVFFYTFYAKHWGKELVIAAGHKVWAENEQTQSNESFFEFSGDKKFDFWFQFSNAAPKKAYSDFFNHFEHSAKVISFHLSHILNLPLEMMMIPGFEESFMDAIAFNSKENMDIQKKFFTTPKDNKFVFPNPAPVSFKSLSNPIKLKKVLMVSHSLQPELVELEKKLSTINIEIDKLVFSKPKLVTADDL